MFRASWRPRLLSKGICGAASARHMCSKAVRKLGSSREANRWPLIGFAGAVAAGLPMMASYRSQCTFCEPPKRRRIAIYGGAYDPITNSHLTCAAELVHSSAIDEVWLVPCGPRPDKPGLKTPAFDRYCMCQIAVNSVFGTEFPVKVSSIDCDKLEAAFTYDLLCELRDTNPNCDFVFVIGTDWLQPGTDIRKWESLNVNWKPGDPQSQRTTITGTNLLEEFDFLIVKRPGYEVNPTSEDPSGLKQFGPRMSWLVMPDGLTFIEGNLSSTEIRKRLKGGAGNAAQLRKIDGLVPPALLGYIYRQGLYV